MAITNIGTLQSAVESFVEDTISDSLFLEMANAVASKLMRGVMAPDGRTWIVPPLRVADMETTDTLTTSGAVVSLPADWLEFKRVWLDTTDGYDLTYRPLRQFQSSAEAKQSGAPVYYTIDAGNLYTAPTTDADIEVTYYQTLGGFTGDSSTDAILTNHPNIYRAGVTAEVYRWKRDNDGLAMETAEFSALARALNVQDKQAQASGSIMVMRPQSVS